MKKTLIILTLLMLAGFVFAQHEPEGCFYYQRFGEFTTGIPSNIDVHKHYDVYPGVTYAGNGNIGTMELLEAEYEYYSGPYNANITPPSPGIGGDAYFVIKGIDTSMYEDIKLSFGFNYFPVQNLNINFTVQFRNGDEPLMNENDPYDPQNWNTIWNIYEQNTEWPIGWTYVEFSDLNIISMNNLWLKFTAADWGVTYMVDDIMLWDDKKPTPVENISQEVSYETIQEAIGYAVSGDVIEVQAGIYTENIIVSKSIELRGLQQRDGLPIIDGDGSGSVITIDADNVVLTGFQIQNSGTGAQDAGVLMQERTGCQIIGNTILDNANGIAVALGSGNTIQDNIIKDNSLYGIGITASIENTIEENDIFDNGLDAIGLDNANIIGGPVSAGATGNIIKNNMIKSNRDGIFLGRNCNNNQIIDGNTISDVNQIGIHLWLSNSNIIDSNNISASGTGIRVRGASENDITANTITENDIGILVEPSQAGDDQLPSENNTFKQNMIFGNTEYGATANHTNQPQYGDVDMLKNWWGNATGPYHASNLNGLGNAVTNNILKTVAHNCGQKVCVNSS